VPDTNSSGANDDLHYVGDANSFQKNGDRILVEIKEREIAVIYANDQYHALLNYCTHQGAPVCEGSLTGTLTENEEREFSWICDDEILTCPWHAWEFDITSGKHITRSEYAIPRFDTRVIDNSVYVSL
jgi:nitrite reductase/ring-hydroxylating ferredoxin subunit